MILDRILNVHEPAHAQRTRKLARGVAHRFQMLGVYADGRQDAGRVARMNPGLFDVLLNSGHYAGLIVRERVHVELRRALKEFIDQHWTLRGEIDSRTHVAFEALFVVDDRHRAPAEHVAGSHEHRVADARGYLSRALDGRRRAVLRLRNAKLAQERAEAFAIFGQVDRKSTRL